VSVHGTDVTLKLVFKMTLAQIVGTLRRFRTCTKLLYMDVELPR
jgi:hypothetical protein